MSDAPFSSRNLSFHELQAGVRKGDQVAVGELVRRYRPELERYIRLCVTNPGLRELVDIEAIVFSVLKSFVLRISTGVWEIAQEADLMTTMNLMIRNRLIDQLRRHRAARRDHRRNRSLRGIDPASPVATPSEEISLQDLIAAFRERLSSLELRIAELRATDTPWNEIGDIVGMTGEAARKLFSRAVDRVCNDLGLSEPPRGSE